MTKLYSVLAGCLLSILAGGSRVAQGQGLPAAPGRVCATQEADAQRQAELKRLNPLYNPAKSTAPDRKIFRTSAVTYTLPVIVHVIHNGEAVGVGTNISQAQVQSQLDVLNEDYRRTNADGTLVPGVYQPLRADVEVQFVAATVDPNGVALAEPGIDRVDRNAKGFSAPPYGGTTSPNTTYIDGTIKPQTSWDPSRYVNIWVMDVNGGGLLGYAQFPDNNAGLGGLSALGGSAATDGVVIKHSAYGSRAKNPTGTYINSYDKGRTLTHELGHWLGLRHIWGDANCGNDYCADTPTQQTSNGGCPAFPQVTCSNVTGDMSMNYMDYTYDACMYMFSAGQKDRMQAIMAANTPRRSTLAAAAATVACPNLVAATAGNGGPACIGGSLNLTAAGPAGATYAWTGPNNYSSTLQNPILTNVTAAMAGVYTVRVSVTTGACPAGYTTTVVVNPAPSVPVLATTAATVCAGTAATLSATNLVGGALPSENFNGAATGWTLANAGVASTAWQYSTSYNYASTYLTLTNYSLDGTRFAIANSDAGGSGSSTNTTLTSPAFSTVGYSGLKLSFLQRLNYQSGDVAAVEVSTNGTTWTAASNYAASVGTPTTAATTTVNLDAFVNQPSVRVRWRYATSWAYYWAIDNVQFTGVQQTPIYTWALVSGDGLPAVTNTPTIAVTPTQSSVYRLTTGFAGASCTSTATVGVNVYQTPVLATSTALVCPGSSATLSATNLAGVAPAPTYTWALVSGDGLPATTNTATIAVTPTQTSVYRLTVGYGGGCTTTATLSVPVAPTPTLVASAAIVCAGSASQLSATNIPASGYTYAWTLVSGNGLPAVTTTPTITVNPTQNSVYRLTVTTGTCATSSTVSVTAITNSIQAYPVPFGAGGLSLQVSTCTVGPISVQIFDILGRRVYDNTVGNAQIGSVTVSLPETARLQPGKYIVKVQQGTQDTRFNVFRQQ